MVLEHDQGDEDQWVDCGPLEFETDYEQSVDFRPQEFEPDSDQWADCIPQQCEPDVCQIMSAGSDNYVSPPPSGHLPAARLLVAPF